MALKSAVNTPRTSRAPSAPAPAETAVGPATHGSGEVAPHSNGEAAPAKATRGPRIVDGVNLTETRAELKELKDDLRSLRKERKSATKKRQKEVVGEVKEEFVAREKDLKSRMLELNELLINTA